MSCLSALSGSPGSLGSPGSPVSTAPPSLSGSETGFFTQPDSRIHIKQASLEDISDIRDIMKNAFKKYVREAGIPVIPCALKESIDDIRHDILNNMVFIVFVNGEPAGSMRLVINHDNTAYLKRFGVKSQFRNMGIGKSLMNLADCIMISNNVKKLYLHTASNYKDLVKFYYDRGFFIESVSTDKGYYRARMVKEYV